MNLTAVCGRHSTATMVGWVLWSSGKNRQSFFPKLAQIAHSIYAIPTTQNKSERAFSAASHVMSELRTTLAIYIFILWFLLSFVFPRLNPLKFTGVARTRQQISAVSRPKFTILWGHVEDILLLNKFFPIVDSCKFIAWQSCAMVPRWRFWRLFVSCVFSEPRAARFRPAS